MKDQCIICGNDITYAFTKEYQPPYDYFLNSSHYYKCNSCGFTCSDTVFKMEYDAWCKLNFDFHTLFENKMLGEDINEPPYIEQATMINILVKNNIIKTNMLDYAGGYGTLSKILLKYFDLSLPVYDPYVTDNTTDTVQYVKEENLIKVNVVVTSALFEHVRKRADLDNINNLVTEDGVMIIHTVVCENIPNDPNWFYITPPVHSALHTNKSMDILMKQWGYVSSIYCPSSKCWVLFKKEPENLKSNIESINKLFQTDYLHYSTGFMNYWK